MLYVCEVQGKNNVKIKFIFYLADMHSPPESGESLAVSPKSNSTGEPIYARCLIQ